LECIAAELFRSAQGRINDKRRNESFDPVLRHDHTQTLLLTALVSGEHCAQSSILVKQSW